MKLDLNTPETQADLEAWKNLVAKTDPFETRSSKLTRTDASGIPYPLVAQSGPPHKVQPTGNQASFCARLGKAPTWDVRAVLSISDDISGNTAILDALTHGATSLEFRLRELKPRSFDVLFKDVTRSFIDLVLIVEESDAQEDVNDVASRLIDFKKCTWVSAGSSPTFLKCTKQTTIALSSLKAIDLSAHPALEIACLLSAAVGYYRAGGASAIGAQEGPALYLTTESTLFMNIAKLRTLKRLYEGIRSSLGAKHNWELMTLSSPRAWTRDAPWNNQLRATSSLMSGAIGGATSIGVLPATDSIESQRIALTSHAVVALESHLGQVQDPAQGSYLIESLTNDLALAAWAIFQELERKGGVSTTDGQMAFEELAKQAQEKREDELARRVRAYVGVTEFPSLEDEASLPPSVIQNHARDSIMFEELRHQKHGLSLRLITLGAPARHLGRKTFAEHALAAGGLQASVVPLEEALLDSFHGIQILCGHDDDYESSQEQIETLLNSNKSRSYIASKKALKDLFPPSQRLYLGMNLLAFLQNIVEAPQED